MKKLVLLFSFLLIGIAGFVQDNPPDSASITDDELLMDTSINIDDLLTELDAFLDSLLAPRSYVLINVNASRTYYNFIKDDVSIVSKGQLRFSPTVGYYHKTGPGITLSGDITDDGKQQNLYQVAVTPSFDFNKSLRWTGGFSYTHYFTKDSLPFYVSPIQNEVSAYFLYRKAWLQPSIAAVYGWGDRKEAAYWINYVRILRLGARRFNDTQIPRPIIDSLLAVYSERVSKEEINDFSMVLSVRHNFYWLNIGNSNNYIRLTPMLSCSFGTQKFGFNQRTTESILPAKNTEVDRFNVRHLTLKERSKFQPLSLTIYLKPELVIGKFFIQPQFLLDYYFPAKENNITALFSVNTGIMF